MAKNSVGDNCPIINFNDYDPEANHNLPKDLCPLVISYGSNSLPGITRIAQHNFDPPTTHLDSIEFGQSVL